MASMSNLSERCTFCSSLNVQTRAELGKRRQEAWQDGSHVQAYQCMFIIPAKFRNASKAKFDMFWK